MDGQTSSRLKALGFSPVGPSSPALVSSLEREVGALPPDYSEFLRTTGGGRCSAEVLCRCMRPPPIAERGLTLVGEFLGFSPGESSLRTAIRRARELGVPSNLLPIADVAGGDLYCLSLGPEDGVVYWDHDSGKSYLAAASFRDFVSRLSKAPEQRRSAGRVDIQLDPDLFR